MEPSVSGEVKSVSERELSTGTVLFAVRGIRSATNVTIMIPSGFLDSTSAASALKERVAGELKSNGYEAVAERYLELVQDINNFYPLVIVSASFVQLEENQVPEEKQLGKLGVKVPLVFVHTTTVRGVETKSYKTHGLESANLETIEKIATKDHPGIYPVFIKINKGGNEEFFVNGTQFSRYAEANEYAWLSYMLKDGRHG